MTLRRRSAESVWIRAESVIQENGAESVWISVAPEFEF
jgi:hypothetical protein